MSSDFSILYVIRDGGGTAPVELTVARKLRARGHRVRVFGPPEVAADTAASLFELHQLAWPPEPTPTDGPPTDSMARLVAAAPAWARELQPHLARADLLITDCAVFGALTAARAAGTPTVSLMPTVYVAEDEMFAGNVSGLAAINRARAAAGLAGVDSITEQLLDADRLLVLTGRDFELDGVRPPANVRYVGPQLPHSRDGHDPQLPAGDDPLVLISLSTTEQDQLDTLQRILDAVATLEVRGLATLGPVDQDQLRVPDRVATARFVPHDRVLPYADLVITHAGHGTVAAAYSAGVPLVCVPMGRDQPAVAERVVAHGLGVSIDPAADVAAIRSAVREVLINPSYRANARRLAGNLEPADRVVTEVESLLRGVSV